MLSPVLIFYLFIGLAFIIYQLHQHRKERIRARLFLSIEQKSLLNKYPDIKNQLAKEYVNQHLEARTTALCILFLSAMVLIGALCFFYTVQSLQEVESLPIQQQFNGTTTIARASFILFVLLILGILFRFYRQNIQSSKLYLKKLDALFRNSGLAC
jgi:hypothetical protein